MVDRGEFRQEMMYRLNVVAIEVPPLRERREDVPVLAKHFLHELCHKNGFALLHMERDLLQFLKQCDWPGNVRQLRNCIESMVVMARGGRLRLADLPRSLQPEPHGDDFNLEIPPNVTLADLEKLAVSQALKRCGGNRTYAANALGISVRTLQRKLGRWHTHEQPPSDKA
jgi:DNA-binding NtrC family response regulator